MTDTTRQLLFPSWEHDHAAEIAEREHLPRRIFAMWRRYGKREDASCRQCEHCIKFDYHNRTYYKCDVYGLTHGGATDWRIKWSACGRFVLAGEQKI